MSFLTVLALLAASVLPAAQANDNRAPSGSPVASEVHLTLDARNVMWFPDGERNRGVPIEAFAERGKAPQIPGPLIRVRAGTVVVATVRNLIPDSVLTMHGMMPRPSDRDRSVRVPSGETRVIRFRAGAPGTYLYWGATKARTLDSRFGSDSQLSGALVVDPPAPAPISNDRVFVISQWDNVYDKSGNPNFDYELNVINGRAWPYTERLTYNRGATVHWRWINAGYGDHPLHLHGFFFSVDSRGDGLADTLYANPSERDRVVTEVVHPGQTFAMTWHADRAGNWLFHCHFAYHIVRHTSVATMIDGRNVMSETSYENEYVRHAGMGGLILALTVRAPGPQLAIPEPTPVRHIHVRVERAADDRPDAPSFRYVLDNGVDSASDAAVGPPIVLTRGVPVAIDVTNALNEPTAIHWHGIELSDSYYDGVSGMSGYGSRRAPMIEPGETFEVRMTPPRAGTFVYHTHMDDVWQLRGGLAGPLIVVEPGVTFDPATDHVFTLTTTHALADELKIFVNGTLQPPAITCRVGVLQRFRFINMTTFWPDAVVSLSDGKRTEQWRSLQVDGAYVSTKRQALESAVRSLTIGQTRDFTFMPRAPGELELQFWPDPTFPSVTVPVHVVE